MSLARLVESLAPDRRAKHAAQRVLRSTPDGRFTDFTVLQEAAAEYPTLRPHRIAIGLYNLASDGALSPHAPGCPRTVTGARTEVAAACPGRSSRT